MLSQQLAQAKGYGSFLKQSGLIDEEIGEKAPDPAPADAAGADAKVEDAKAGGNGP